MNFTTNDNHPVLAAPRPVRLSIGQYTRSHSVRLASSQENHVERARIGDHDTDDLRFALYAESPSEKDLASLRSSPRSGLPSEALEEFLSILRPSLNFFPPTSPSLRTRRQGGTASLPTFQHERSYSLKGRSRLENRRSDHNLDELETVRSAQASRNTRPSTPESLVSSDLDGVVSFDFSGADSPPVRWFTSNMLSSPISRMHTRNPFLRHSSTQSPGPGHISPLSPAAVPLPLPTPDEMVEVL